MDRGGCHEGNFETVHDACITGKQKIMSEETNLSTRFEKSAHIKDDSVLLQVKKIENVKLGVLFPEEKLDEILNEWTALFH